MVQRQTMEPAREPVRWTEHVKVRVTTQLQPTGRVSSDRSTALLLQRAPGNARKAVRPPMGRVNAWKEKQRRMMCVNVRMEEQRQMGRASASTSELPQRTARANASKVRANVSTAMEVRARVPVQAPARTHEQMAQTNPVHEICLCSLMSYSQNSLSVELQVAVMALE